MRVEPRSAPPELIHPISHIITMYSRHASHGSPFALLMLVHIHPTMPFSLLLCPSWSVRVLCRCCAALLATGPGSHPSVPLRPNLLIRWVLPRSPRTATVTDGFVIHLVNASSPVPSGPGKGEEITGKEKERGGGGGETGLKIK